LSYYKAITIFFISTFLLTGLCLYGKTTTASGYYDDDYPDYLEIKIAVMGPGDELYFWWGHIALIIEDYETGRSRFYDWGMFSFENENFFLDFAFGRLLYTCGASSPDWNFRHYIDTGRSITIYTLNLPAEAKEKIKQYAEFTILPENKDYYYHHFRDNCATRIRDIIDLAVDGQFREKYENTPGRFTYREHVRRHTWFNPFFDWILNFWMGRTIDMPLTVWDEMFLPSEIGLRIQEFSYIDPDNKEQQLFVSDEVLYRTEDRPAVLNAPKPRWPGALILSCVVSLILLLFIIFMYLEKPKMNYVWAIGQGALGLFFGVAGTILFFMAFFTNHDYTYWNINLIFANPLLLAALPFGIIYCIKYSRMNHHIWEIYIKSLWSLILCLGIISIIVNIFFGQRNQTDIALVLPVAAAASWLPDGLIYIRREYLWRWLN